MKVCPLVNVFSINDCIFAAQTMHQTYDPNLIRDDDRDILVQLESKHNRQRRVSEIGLRKYSGRRAFSFDGAMDAQQRRRESSTTSGEDSVFFTNETGGSRHGYIRQLSQGNRQAERLKKLSPKMRRHSSHQSSYRSSGSSGFAGHDNLAYIEEDDESATSEDILDKDDIVKKGNSIINNITEEEMTDSMRRKRKMGTGQNPQGSVPTKRLSIGPDTLTELEPKQANGVVPSDTFIAKEESELRQQGDQSKDTDSTTNEEELDTTKL